jgi:hypothetical protein
MITITIEVLLVIVLVMILMNLFRKKPRAIPPAIPPQDLANLKPRDARVGDVISVSGAGDEYSDLDFTADRQVWYQAGNRRWFDLSGPYRERRVSLRVSNDSDGEPQVYVHTDTRKPSIEEFGLTEKDLADMDERQNTGDWFEFEGRSWLYRISREAQATGGSNGPASFYYWEFQEKDGNGLLAIRKAEGEPFSAMVFTGVPPGNVTVYRGARA